MAGDQTRQSQDPANAQACQGAGMSEDANMEDKVPLRGVPPLWQLVSPGNVAQP